MTDQRFQVAVLVLLAICAGSLYVLAGLAAVTMTRRRLMSQPSEPSP